MSADPFHTPSFSDVFGGTSAYFHHVDAHVPSVKAAEVTTLRDAYPVNICKIYDTYTLRVNKRKREEGE
jgi:hypothetical protein